MSPAYRTAQQGATALLMRHGSDLPGAMQQANALIYGQAQQQASMLAFNEVALVQCAAFALLLPLLFFMKKMVPHKSEIAAH